jgi:serine protease Do
MTKRLLLTAISAMALSAAAFASQVKIYISSGTGFLVSRDGYIVTNLHVVNYCQRITVAGALPVHEAKVVARDSDNDLALLKVETMGAEVGQFSSFREPLNIKDRVLIVGYPGQAAVTRNTVTRETEILNTTGPRGEEKWIQLGDVIEQGNSGGPLLDTAGNVVGVVSAKVLTYTYREDAPQDGVSRQFGVAIAVPVVEEFLDNQHVRYRTSDAGDYLSADRITDNARRFVVNVRCEYKTELR